MGAPNARRPWQYVLEPLSGYLYLGEVLMRDDGQRYAEAWNFGPATPSICTVADLADKFIGDWGAGSWEDPSNQEQLHEAGWLALKLTIPWGGHPCGILMRR